MLNRVLITGVNGFIGRYTAKELQKNKNIQIMGIDRKIDISFGSNVIVKKIDLLDKDKLKKAISEFKPTCVIHLAAIAKVVYENVGELYDINVHGSENLLDILYEVCEPNTRVVLTSSAAVYGNSNKDFITEDTPYNLQNHYAFSKMVMEYIAKKYKDKLDIKITRPFNVVGFGQNEEFLIPKLVKAFVNKQSFLNVGNMNTYRDYIDVNFVAKIYCKLALSPNVDSDVINICTGHGTTGNDILSLLQSQSIHQKFK